MPESMPVEFDNKPKPIGEQIYDEFKLHNHKLINREDLIAQVNVLKNLPENFVEQAYGHIQSEYKNQQRLRSEHPDTFQIDFDDRCVMEGFANEVFANIQIRQTHPELRGNTNPEVRAVLDNYENKILSVANNPERFGLELSTGRNPDAAWLDLDTDGRVIIKGIGEITTSHQLNKRKYLQLRDSGFASSLRYVAKHLNGLSDGEARGLPEFGLGKKQVEVSSDLKKYLVVNHDMDTTPEGLVNSIGETVPDDVYAKLDFRERRKKFSATEKESFLNILKSPNTVIIKSAFTNEDSRTVADFLIRKIKEKYPSYQNQL